MVDNKSLQTQMLELQKQVELLKTQNEAAFKHVTDTLSKQAKDIMQKKDTEIKALQKQVEVLDYSIWLLWEECRQLNASHRSQIGLQSRLWSRKCKNETDRETWFPRWRLAIGAKDCWIRMYNTVVDCGYKICMDCFKNKKAQAALDKAGTKCIRCHFGGQFAPNKALAKYNGKFCSHHCMTMCDLYDS